MESEIQNPKSRFSLWALLALLVLCAPLAARQVDFVNMGVPEYRAARVQSQIEPAFEHVRAKTGLADVGPIFLTIVASGKRFAEIAQHDGVAMDAESVLGYAMPGRRRVVLNFSAMDERGLEPLGVLRHEIAHLVLGGLPSARPLWFEEGVAQYVESVALNQLIEASSPANDEYTSLDDLSQALRTEGRTGPAYSAARNCVNFLVSRHGEAAFKRLLADLAQGHPFDQAFSSHCEPLTAFESAWIGHYDASWLVRRHGSSFAQLPMYLLIPAGLIVVGGVWLIRRRARKQIAEWQEQEELFPSDPAWSYTRPDEGYSTDDDEDDAEPVRR